MSKKKDVKTFPLRLENSFSTTIDKAVFFTDADSKHQYILDAVREKIKRDNDKFPQILKDEVV